MGAAADAKAASARADTAAKAKGIYMRCGPRFGNIRCAKKGDYCSEGSSWCGSTAGHKRASSGKFDFKAIKPAKAAAAATKRAADAKKAAVAKAAAEADTKKAAAAAAKAASDRADTAAKAKGIYMRCGPR